MNRIPSLSRVRFGGVREAARRVVAAPPSFTDPNSLSPVAWFRLSSGAFQSDGVTPAGSGDTMQFLKAEGNAAKYFEQVTAGNRPVLSTVGGMLCFSGLTSAVNRFLRMAGTSTLITTGTNWSVSLWLKCPQPDVTFNTDVIFSESGSSPTSPNRARTNLTTPVGGDPKLYLEAASDTSSLVTVSVAGPTILDDTWHHLVWTDANGSVVFYIDGVAQTPTSYTRVSPYNPTRQGLFCVPRTTITNGGCPGYLGNNLVLDNKIWSAGDVANLYAFG